MSKDLHRLWRRLAIIYIYISLYIYVCVCTHQKYTLICTYHLHAKDLQPRSGRASHSAVTDQLAGTRARRWVMIKMRLNWEGWNSPWGVMEIYNGCRNIGIVIYYTMEFSIINGYRTTNTWDVMEIMDLTGKQWDLLGK